MTQSIKKISGFGSIAFAALMLLVLPVSFARAADFGDMGGYDFYPADTSYDFYPSDTSYDFYPSDSSYDFYPDSYDTYGGYGYTGGYSTGGFMTGGYTTGYMTGGGYTVGTPVHTVTTPSTPSNTNYCTNNSCNHDDHSVVNITNPAPVINNNNVVANYGQPQPQVQVCAAGFYGTYPNCYRPAPVAPVVAYNQTPYISLSEAPYTGLELGFWGSVAYWGFLVAFALFAAYLIAVKRVQNSIAAWLKSVLFGDEAVTVAHSHVRSTIVTAPAAPAPAAINTDAIDPFILSQINRRG